MSSSRSSTTRTLATQPKLYADHVVLGLLADLATDPCVGAISALHDRLGDLEIPVTPVNGLGGRLPRWAAAAWRVRQPQQYGETSWRDINIMFRTSRILDHYGKTDFFGVDALVTEPYRKIDDIIPQLLRIARYYGMVPVACHEAAWNSGCRRGMLLNREQVLAVVRENEERLQSLRGDETGGADRTPTATQQPVGAKSTVWLGEMNPKPRRWGKPFREAFDEAFVGRFDGGYFLVCAGLSRRMLDELDPLTRVDARIFEVLSVAKSFRAYRPVGWCRANLWHGWPPHQGQGLQQFVERLVGVHREDGPHPLLSTPRAYETIANVIFGKMLPSCKHAGECHKLPCE